MGRGDGGGGGNGGVNARVKGIHTQHFKHHGYSLLDLFISKCCF